MELRESGLSGVGKLPWGSHLCHFYSSTEELLEMLVPFFRAGLQANEQCVWVPSESLSSHEAALMLGRLAPDFAEQIISGQMLIIPRDEWYRCSGGLDVQAAFETL